MEEFKMLPVLLLFLLSASGKIEFGNTHKDKYSEFKEVPEYISDPSPDREPYFIAYDKTMEQWNVAFEELYVETSKGTAHVIVSGPEEGTSVVLMNGMAASSTMWYPNAKALASKHRVFAIDLIIEPGKSYKTNDIKNIDGINIWYQEVFNKLQLESYHLIGTSRGGWLATDLAIHDTRVKSVILLSPVQTLAWLHPSAGLLKNMLNIFYPKHKRAMRTMETLSNDPSKIDKDYIEQYRLALENDSLNKFMGQMRPFSRKELRSLDMPVLVLVGDRDLFNTKRSVRKAEKYISKVEGEVISNSGHFLTIDQTELVNEKMLNFLRTVDNGGEVEDVPLEDLMTLNLPKSKTSVE